MTARFVPSNVAEMVDWLAGAVSAQTGMTINTGAGGASGGLTLQTNSTTRMSISFAGAISVASGALDGTTNRRFFIPATSTDPGTGGVQVLTVTGTAKGNNGTTGSGMYGHITHLSDDASAVSKSVSSWASNGGLFEGTTATAHGFSAGDRIVVYGASTGTNNPPNGAWVVAATPSSTKFTLTGSTYGAATGGTVTNRPYLCGYYSEVSPAFDRGGGTGTIANFDDATAFIAKNTGAGKATEAFYVAAGSGGASVAHSAALGIGGTTDTGIAFGANVTNYGIDFAYANSPTYGSGTIRLPNGTGGKVVARNNAGSADVGLFCITSNDYFALLTDTFFSEGKNLVLGSTTGTKIGTSIGQKLGFFNATPIVQPASTDDLRTALINLGLYASGGASPLNLNGGTLTAAKAILGTNAATTGVLNIPNSSPVYGRNNLNNADINLFTVDTNDHFKFNTSVQMADGAYVLLGTSTGTKIGTATSQLLGFWNATPIVQPTALTDIADGLVNVGLRATSNLLTPTIKASPVVGAAKDVQVFNQGTNQTWTKPATGNVAVIIVKGAGGGGGGGATGASSINGGAGGGGGGWLICGVPLAALGSTANVNVAAGGAGGAAGNAGSNASGTTAFDSAGGNANVTAATGGGAGGAGSPTGGSGGSATAPTYTGYAVTSASTNGGTGGGSSSFVGQAGATGAGGGGGGINATPTAQAGGAGNVSGPTATANGAAGAAGAGASATNGAPSIAGSLHALVSGLFLGGGGGGGATGGSGKNGGAGAYGVGGGGGGGGGSCVTGGTAGAGGAGGDGCVVVLVY